MKGRRGYILISRDIVESQVWDKPPLYIKLWIWLLQKANHSGKSGLERGQVFTSYKEMAEALSWHVGYRKETPKKDDIYKILRFFNTSYESDTKATTGATTKATMTQTMKATGGVLITICNYNTYQNPKFYESNNEGNNESDNESDHESVTKANLPIINKNDKNEKNVYNPPKPPFESGEVEKVMELYNTICVSMPKCRSLTSDRRKKIKSRLKDFGIDLIEQALYKAEQSDFLSGRNGEWTSCNIDWLFKNQGNMTKVLEGNYDNRGNAKMSTYEKLKQAYNELG